MALEILGLSVDIFDRVPTMADFRRIRLRGEEDAGFYGLFLAAAEARGRDDLARVLRRRLLAYEARRALIDFTNLAFSEAVTRRLRRRPAGDENVDIGLSPRYSDAGVRARVLERLGRGELPAEVPVGSVYA